jgi:hypothetical protein
MSELRVDTINEATSGEGTTISKLTNPNEPFRNLLINGDMKIAQRATSTSSITGNGYHTVDRMNSIISSQGTWTQSQSTTVPTGQGFTKSLKMDCTSADASPAASDILRIQQAIEGQNLQHLKYGTSSAESTTLSFWVRSNKTGTYVIQLLNGAVSRQVGKTYTISSADTWEKKTITFPGDTSTALDNDNSAELYVQFCLGTGSNRSSGTLSSTWKSFVSADQFAGQTVNLADSTSNEWYITGIQLEVGEIATDFEHLPFDVQLMRCQRYCQKWDFTASPGFASIGRTLSSNRVDLWFEPKLEMRAEVDAISDSLTTSTIYRGDGTRHDGVTQTGTQLTNSSKAAFGVRKTYSDTIEGDNLVSSQFGGTLIATCEL